ncbi:hypothetical protein, partial [Frischella perrara]|uniref:hypothetical protein n=1 Tax=Frischella perrara TaxID=1267021 RepID=UPI0023F0AA84
GSARNENEVKINIVTIAKEAVYLFTIKLNYLKNKFFIIINQFLIYCFDFTITLITFDERTG